MSASAYRQDIMDLVKRYGTTPGGAPPGEIVEAMVQAESGGDITARNQDGGLGLGLIDPDSDAWAWYLEDRSLVAQYGTDPNTVLVNPRANLEILAMELNRRQELGLAAVESGEPGAWQDWMVAAMGHWGHIDNAGKNGQNGANAAADYGEITKYAIENFGADRVTAIDAENPGTVEIDTHSRVPRYVPGQDTKWTGLSPSLVDVVKDKVDDLLPDLPGVGDWRAALSKLTGNAARFGMRAGLFIVGAFLALAGLWFVFGRNK